MKNIKVGAGFTRIEIIILLVIVLAGAALAVRATLKELRLSRDAKRISSIQILQNGVEKYFMDKQSYPEGAGLAIGKDARIKECASLSCASLSSEYGWSSNIKGSEYIKNAPTDPSNKARKCDGVNTDGPCQFTYYQNGKEDYKIFFFLEGSVGGFQAGNCSASKNGIRCSGDLK